MMLEQLKSIGVTCKGKCDEPHRNQQGAEHSGLGHRTEDQGIDDLLQPQQQSWVFEVHPEVSFWCLNGRRPMTHSKSRLLGREERRAILRREFPDIERHLEYRPTGVGADDLLDAAAAAWSALRLWEGRAESVCVPNQA